jgi:ABC-type transport system substrate-binding protein
VGFCHPAFDAILARADTAPDPAERLSLYEQAERLLVADAPAVFWFNLTNIWLVKPHVTGYVTTPRDLWPGSASALTLDLAPVTGKSSA